MQICFNQDHIFHSIPSSLVSLCRSWGVSAPLEAWWEADEWTRPTVSIPLHSASPRARNTMTTVINHLILLPFVCIQTFISFSPLNFCGFTTFWTAHSFPLEYHIPLFNVCSIFFSLSFFLHLCLNSFTVLSWLTPCPLRFAPLSKVCVCVSIYAFIHKSYASPVRDLNTD